VEECVCGAVCKRNQNSSKEPVVREKKRIWHYETSRQTNVDIFLAFSDYCPKSVEM
jgi:hypothetical protein